MVRTVDVTDYDVVFTAGKMPGSGYREGTPQGYMLEGQIPGTMTYPQQGSSAAQMVRIIM